MFLPIFCRRPVSRDIDCCSLAKISEILAGADILLTPIFVTFSAWFRYNKPVQCGRESAHKSRATSGNSTLGDCMWRDQHLLGEHQRGLGEGSCCGLCHAITVRRCFCICANILSTQVFCRREYFFDTNILSMRVFCQRQHLVDGSILSTTTFCQLEYFVNFNILSPPIVCCHHYFVCI